VIADKFLQLAHGNSGLTPEFVGPWFIYSISHQWEGKQYINGFTCIRSFNIDDK
jgi:hypothetical protein